MNHSPCHYREKLGSLFPQEISLLSLPWAATGIEYQRFHPTGSKHSSETSNMVSLAIGAFYYLWDGWLYWRLPSPSLPSILAFEPIVGVLLAKVVVVQEWAGADGIGHRIRWRADTASSLSPLPSSASTSPTPATTAASLPRLHSRHATHTDPTNRIGV